MPKPREAAQTRQWEKKRRERFNDEIASLWKLLPKYDPLVTINKLDILRNTAAYIKSLQKKVEDLLDAKSDKEPEKEEIKRLQDKVKKLINRNEQLTLFLQHAGISVPSAYGIVKKPKRAYPWPCRGPWTTKVPPEQTAKKKKEEKENENGALKRIKLTKPAIAREKKSGMCKKTATKSNKRKKHILSKNVILIQQPVSTQPCIILTNTASISTMKNTSGSTVVTNSTLLTTPLMSTNITPIVPNKKASLDSLGPGTLIFPSGKVLSILPQIPQPLNTVSNITVLSKTNISNQNCSLVNNLSNISETVKNSSASNLRVSSSQIQKKIPRSVKSDSINQQVLILPKRRCLTRTTQANKVPIPSLSSYNSTFKMEISQNLTQVVQKLKANDEKKEKTKPDQVSTEIKNNPQVETDKNLDKLPIKETNLHDDGRKMEIDYQEDVLLNTDIKENHNDKKCSESSKTIGECTESEGSNNIKIISSVCLKEAAIDKQESQDKIPAIKVTNTEQSQIKEHTNEKLDTESKVSTGGLPEEVVKSSEEYFDTSNVPAPAKSLHEYTSTPFDKDETETEKLNNEVSALTEEANPGFCISPQKSDILQNFNSESLNEKSHEKQKSLDDRNEMKTLELNLPHSDLSNDIFASLQVPSGCQNPESTSPTAAFLLAFPLVSSLTGVKVSEVLDEENTVSQNGTPTLLQIGTMDTTKPTQSESLTPSLLNLDNLSFFSSKDICSSLYSSFDNIGTNNNNSHIANASSNNNKNDDAMSSQMDLSKESEISSIKKVAVAEQIIKESLLNRENNIQGNASFDPISAHNVGENPNQFSSDNNNCDINKKSDQKEIFNKTATNSVDAHYDKKEIKNIHTAKEVLNKREEIIHSNRNIESNESNLACMASTSVKSHDLRNLNHCAPNINDQANITNNNNNNINKIRQLSTIPSNSNNNNKIENVTNHSNSNMTEHVIRNSINNNQKIETLNNIGHPISSRRNIDFEQHTNVSINFTSNSIPAVNTTAPYQVPNVINYQSKQKCEESTEKNIEHKNFANFNHRIQSTNQTNKYNNPPFNNYQNINSSKSYITCSYNYIPKSYIEPLYTNSTSYSYHSANNDNYYKRSDSKNYYVGYDNYNDCRNNQVANNYYVNPQNTQKNKQNTNQVRQPINWMTTPDVRQNNEYLLPPFSKENDYLYPSNCFISGNQNNYFNSNAMYSTPEVMSEPKKAIELPPVPMNSYQKIDIEENHRENQFSWSPTKLPQILEPPTSFVPASLTNLVGDLALGNTGNYNTAEQKCERYQKDGRGKDNNNIRRSKITSTGYENQSNFLSVSQLVDHNKSDNVPARPNSRRNSGSRLPKGTPSSKIHKRNSGSKDVKDNNSQSYSKNEQVITKNNQYNMQGNDIFCDTNSNVNTVKNRSVSKNVSSSYSAEALIGHQMQSDIQNKNPDQYTSSSKSLTVPPFLTDNIIPYLPPVDLQQENSFSQSQNYQSTSFSHNFPTTFQNNNYNNNLIPSTTITSSYLQTNNFMPEIPNHDYIPDNFNLFPSKDNKNCSKSAPKTLNRTDKPIQTTCSNYKKTKRKHSNETSLPNFVDFSFLTVPGAINSPILPDDFHTHSTFLPPPPTSQIYPCKNPLYPKQGSDLASSSLLPLPPPVPVNRTNIQPEVSPSLNSGGTSLTNFNLSTIFPEINKQGPISNLYPDSRQKDQPVVKSYSSASSHAPFNSKSSFSLSYINCPQTTQYNH